MERNRVLGHLCRWLRTPVDTNDGELLERFLRQRDEAAFALLVRRHGPLVLGLCRRLLRQPADADDAFQAVFLVLARKAGAIRKREALGSWLYGVALRTAREANDRAERRRSREVAAGDEPVADGAAGPLAAARRRQARVHGVCQTLTVANPK